MEEYRDQYKKSYLMSVSIWPSMYGETPLQHYNSCFSIAHMQEHSDICLNFQNDCILKNLNKVNLVNETEATTSMTAQDKIADLNEATTMRQRV